MLRFIVSQALFLVSMPALAQATLASPVGLWQSLDDATGKPRAEIRITEAAGVVTGRIERSLLSTPPDVLLQCMLCPDERKDKPLIGLEIIRQMKPVSDTQTWEGSNIFDPDKGKIFRAQLELQEGGKKLQVRGFISPFFRNQTWIRIS